MQGPIQNSITGVLAIAAPENRAAITETSEIQPFTQSNSFSEILGSAAEKPLTPMNVLVSPTDLNNGLEPAGFTGQLLIDNGEVFPLEGQKLPVIVEAIPNSAQLPNEQQNEAVQGSSGTSTASVQLDMQVISEQQALINSGLTLAQEKSNDVRTAYASALNGTLQGGVQQQQIRNSLNQAGVHGERHSDTTAPLLGEASLLSENKLFSMPNSAKIVDGLLRVGEFSASNEKLITNEPALFVQSLSISRAGFGE